jgi:solute carrier family 31 (copper transporter), member 1
MLWNWTTIDSCFLSRSWHNTTTAKFAGSVIGVFYLVIAIEGVRRLGREYDRKLVLAHKVCLPDSLL